MVFSVVWVLKIPFIIEWDYFYLLWWCCKVVFRTLSQSLWVHWDWTRLILCIAVILYVFLISMSTRSDSDKEVFYSFSIILCFRIMNKCAIHVCCRIVYLHLRKSFPTCYQKRRSSSTTLKLNPPGNQKKVWDHFINSLYL